MSENSRAKDIAEAILMVIKRIAKWIAIAVVVIIAIFALGIWYTDFESERKRERALIEAAERNEELAKSILISVKVDDPTCTGNFPFKLQIQNISKKVIRSVDYAMTVTYEGRSTVLNDPDRELSSDIILKPGEGYWECITVNERYSYSETLQQKPGRERFSAEIRLVDAVLVDPTR
jgi:hypothetical protein